MTKIKSNPADEHRTKSILGRENDIEAGPEASEISNRARTDVSGQ